MTQRHPRAMALAAALTSLCRAQDAPERKDPTAADLLAAAKLARARGAQAELLACGHRLRANAPHDPIGPFLIAAAHASLGPAFARDVALHAFARVLAMTADGVAPGQLQPLLDLAGTPRSGGCEALRAAIHGWRSDLARGEVLLLAPDRAALAAASARAERRVAQEAEWVAAERSKLARLQRQKKEAQRALLRERTRARNREAAFIDLQPHADRVASCARSIAACEHALREHDASLRALRERARRLAARLAQLE